MSRIFLYRAGKKKGPTLLKEKDVLIVASGERRT